MRNSISEFLIKEVLLNRGKNYIEKNVQALTNAVENKQSISYIK